MRTASVHLDQQCYKCEDDDDDDDDDAVITIAHFPDAQSAVAKRVKTKRPSMKENNYKLNMYYQSVHRSANTRGIGTDEPG